VPAGWYGQYAAAGEWRVAGEVAARGARLPSLVVIPIMTASCRQPG
jgi:hypothetical protein